MDQGGGGGGGAGGGPEFPIFRNSPDPSFVQSAWIESSVGSTFKKPDTTGVGCPQ